MKNILSTNRQKVDIIIQAISLWQVNGNQNVLVKKNLLEIWEECKQDNAERGFREDNKDEWEQIKRNTHDYPWHFDREHNYIYKGSYYIGEGESYVIERNQGSQEHGWQPYC